MIKEKRIDDEKKKGVGQFERRAFQESCVRSGRHASAFLLFRPPEYRYKRTYSHRCKGDEANPLAP